jgi:RHS repeat-associated protein
MQTRWYTTYERDENGSYEAMNRRYNRWWSRFEQPDPWDGSYDLTDPQSFNRYSYVRNDPVNSVDPTGLDPDDPTFGLGPPPPPPGYDPTFGLGEPPPAPGTVDDGDVERISTWAPHWNPREDAPIYRMPVMRNHRSGGGGRLERPQTTNGRSQTSTECRAEALRNLANTLNARADAYPPASSQLITVITTAVSGGRMGGAAAGAPGVLVGVGIGASVGLYISNAREARIEAKPVKDFYKQAGKCDAIAKQEAADARRYGPSMGASLPQMFVVTRQFGVFALYSYTIAYGPTALGDYFYEDHGPNPNDPVTRRFGWK